MNTTPNTTHWQDETIRAVITSARETSATLWEYGHAEAAARARGLMTQAQRLLDEITALGPVIEAAERVVSGDGTADELERVAGQARGD